MSRVIESARVWWASLRMIVSVAFGADRASALIVLIFTPLMLIVPALGALAAGLLTDAAVDGDWSAIVRASALGAVAILLVYAAQLLVIYAVHALDMRSRVEVRSRIAAIVTELPGIEHHEHPEYLDKVRVLRSQSSSISFGWNALSQGLAVLVQAGFVLALLASYEPWLLLLPLSTVLPMLLNARALRVLNRTAECVAEGDRLRHRLHHLVSDVPVAREARLFGAAEELRRHRARLAAFVIRQRDRAQVHATGLQQLGQLVFAAAYLAAIAWTVQRAASGHISPGAVLTVVLLAGQVRSLLETIAGEIRTIGAVLQAGERLRWLHAYRDSRIGQAAPSKPPPERIADGIVLRNVSFAYPGADPDREAVLHDISLRLAAGSTVALVGENGAGKSTLVKLLLRLYEPTSGMIYVDDVDLADIDLKQWRGEVSAAFQDFCKPEFTAREAVSLGDIERTDIEPAVRVAVRVADLEAVIDGLDDGLATQLGAQWEGGVDLSGGQWQRFALGRARMRSQPLLQILDEPTAALDAVAEATLFEGYATASISALERGGITVLVTHRFSTVRLADLIVVLEGGRVVECGSHSQLVDAGGLYAELFHLQAASYTR